VVLVLPSKVDCGLGFHGGGGLGTEEYIWLKEKRGYSLFLAPLSIKLSRRSTRSSQRRRGERVRLGG
jgi:hypothetical protein